MASRRSSCTCEATGALESERPKTEPKTPLVYVKKDTWHETMRASLEATFAPMLEKERAAQRTGLRQEIARLASEGQPVRLELQLGETERLYFATLGRHPENGSAHFLRPRLFDKEGNFVELALDGSMMAEKVAADVARPSKLKIGGVAYRGIEVAPGEIGFKLDRRYERLEVFVYYRRGSRGLPPHAAIGCRPILARAQECRKVWEALRDKVTVAFRDRQTQIEMEMERSDGVWCEYAPTWNAATDAYYLARTKERLELARVTLQFVERSAPRPELAAELMAFEKRLAGVTGNGVSLVARDLFAQAVDLRRRIIFSHPLLGCDRLLLTKRPPPALSAPGDGYYGINNGPGPGLVILDGWKTRHPKETVLLEGKLPQGCAMQPDLSFDGERIVFAYADHTRPRALRQFFLYEIGVEGTGLRQITGTNDDPLAGAGGRMTVLAEDYDPCYLPDGGFAFISTRNQGGVRCHTGGRYCPTFLLYRCNGDGSGVRQLSFGEANEWDPMVMPDGQIIWMRWDYINRPVIPTFGLWTTRPDGTAAAHYFGNYTPNPCRICQPRPVPARTG